MKSFAILLFLPFILLAQHDYPIPSVVEPLTDYDVLSYSFNWHFSFSPRFSYDVKEIIELELLRDVERIIFDCVGLNVYACSLLTTNSSLEYTVDGSSLSILLGRRFSSGDTLRLGINYTGGANQAFYATNTRYGARIYYTLCFASTARRIFPSIDHPLDKAFFRSEFSLPAGFLVASNGELIYESSTDTTYFCSYVTNYPMATYLFAIHIFPYATWRRTTEDGIPVIIYYYPRDSSYVFFDFGRVDEILEFYQNIIGDYPFEKVGYAEAPVFSGYGAMENQTIITFGDRLINGRRTYESVVAHELSHQWFGDAVTVACWRDFWLNEGFAQYAELLFIEQFYPGQFRSAIHSLHQEFFNHEAEEGRFPIYDPEVYLGYTVYYKGAAVLHMLRFLLGDSLFFESLHYYFERFKYRNVTTDSFVAVCEEVSGIELDWFFNEWVYERGYPELEYYFRTYGDTTKVFIYQVQRDAPRVFIMPVEILLTGPTGNAYFRSWIADSVESLSFVCEFEVSDVIIDPNEWLLMKVRRSTGIKECEKLPKIVELLVYPNPFNESVNISFKSPYYTNGVLKIVDIYGRVLEMFPFMGERFIFKWNATTTARDILPSSLYFIIVETQKEKIIKKALLLK